MRKDGSKNKEWGAEEIWLPIPLLAGFEVSSIGRVKRLGDGSQHKAYGRDTILKPQKGGRHVCLWSRNGEVRVTSISIGALVLTAFVEAAPNSTVFCLHKDDDPKNNAVSNLYWGDDLDNGLDRIKNGRTTKGQTVPPERRAAISAKLIGIKLSAETRLKMSVARKGRKLTVKHRAAISAATKGKPKSKKHKVALSNSTKAFWAKRIVT